ncbi:siderophore-interacting protein [Streptomyces sp. NPDC059740]|uniref:siderophore-interacting protein n=1 Tax=Streptomyces sp. NPDC059740 TaxID=3346926 RepID=UPI0036673FAE
MTSARPARKKSTTHCGEVVRTERLTPHMVRVVLGGDGLSQFAVADVTDAYVKLLFPVPGVAYPEPFDMGAIREEFPRDQWPVSRTYTVRHWDAERRELALDFVVHGDEGLAGPWALQAAPGQRIHFGGPGGAYKPDATADWHLLAGDESALPAIAAALEGMPADAVVHAFVEVADASEEQPLAVPAGGRLTWLHRDGAPVGKLLVDAVQSMDWPQGRVQAFVHGEAGFVKDLRRLLRLDHGVPREDLSVSGYWRTGHNEDGWQASKREWNAEVEAEQESSGR